ncbi:hypothetical protein DY000_02017772 [Brassica cretica]|uniref:Uncharacterized protein n=1 Tax=Brassica cretica TaxID=69181 RepID=A0ABQ7CP76_BRACR|nr:hypothetical protein DY000_02017772 [Brassica cretica]
MPTDFGFKLYNHSWWFVCSNSCSTCQTDVQLMMFLILLEKKLIFPNQVCLGRCQDDSGKSTDTGHLIDKLHGLGSFRPPSTTALSLLLLNILISSRTWLVVPPRMIVLFLSLTPPLVVSKLVSLRMDRPMSTLSLLHP